MSSLLLQKCFRWFGPSFGISLEEIRQLGVTGVVTACHEVPIGEVWPLSRIKTLKDKIEAQNMAWSVVESVNVHDQVKYGGPDRDRYIENYIATLKNLSENGIHTVCYNFMGIMDWTRTDLNYKLPNGTISLRFDPKDLAAFDLFVLKRKNAKESYELNQFNAIKTYFESLPVSKKKALEQTILAGLPGSKKSVSMNVFKEKLERVSEVDKMGLRENLRYFLRAVIPEAEELNMKLAIHPDDPPFSIFGVPRVVSTYEDLKFILECYPSPNNGITFCSGSLGVSVGNDLVKIVTDFGHSIQFIHLRNIVREPGGGFYESSHLNGSLPMKEVMEAILKEQSKRNGNTVNEGAIPIRPDHGLLFFDDQKRAADFYPGYSFIGRALGLAELSGLELGLNSVENLS